MTSTDVAIMKESHGESPFQQSGKRSSRATCSDSLSSAFDIDQAEQDYDAWMRSRTICTECKSILYLLYREWEPTEINSIHSTNHNLPELLSSAQQCPLCDLFLADFHSRGFEKADIEAWGDQNTVTSPLRWPSTDLRGIRLEVLDPRKPPVQHIVEVASLHLFRPSILFRFLVHPSSNSVGKQLTMRIFSHKPVGQQIVLGHGKLSKVGWKNVQHHIPFVNAP